jgi:hypothetical protein
MEMCFFLLLVVTEREDPYAANRQDQREERKGARLTMKYLWCLYVTVFSLLVVEKSWIV